MPGAAKMGGAEIVEHNRVLETNPRADGNWDVVTEQGTIHAERRPTGSLWAREVGAMAGVYLPLLPMAHQYLVTDDIPEIMDILKSGKEFPHVMDPGGESYLRQEGRGLCIGFYEKPCEPWSVDGTPWTFGHELLNEQFDKIEDSVTFAYRRFPVLERTGVKRVIHGPFTFALDGNLLIGLVPGLSNYWSACAVMAGFSQGGGMGKSLAEWMIHGETEVDPRGFDVARFGKWTTPGYTVPKVIENYQMRFSVSYPNEERPAARPFRTTPMYDIFDGMGAVWGAQYGLEVVNYFALPGEPRYETKSFKRSNAGEATRRQEVMAVREAVGINGPGTASSGSQADAAPGLTGSWRVRSKRAPVADPDAVAQGQDHRRLHRHLPFRDRIPDHRQLWRPGPAPALVRGELDAGVSVENVSWPGLGFQIAGPNARELLARVTRADVSGAAFRFVDAPR